MRFCAIVKRTLRSGSYGWLFFVNSRFVAFCESFILDKTYQCHVLRSCQFILKKSKIKQNSMVYQLVRRALIQKCTAYKFVHKIDFKPNKTIKDGGIARRTDVRLGQ